MADTQSGARGGVGKKTWIALGAILFLIVVAGLIALTNKDDWPAFNSQAQKTPNSQLQIASAINNVARSLQAQQQPAAPRQARPIDPADWLGQVWSSYHTSNPKAYAPSHLPAVQAALAGPPGVITAHALKGWSGLDVKTMERILARSDGQIAGHIVDIAQVRYLVAVNCADVCGSKVAVYAVQKEPVRAAKHRVTRRHATKAYAKPDLVCDPVWRGLLLDQATTKRLNECSYYNPVVQQSQPTVHIPQDQSTRCDTPCRANPPPPPPKEYCTWLYSLEQTSIRLRQGGVDGRQFRRVDPSWQPNQTSRFGGKGYRTRVCISEGEYERYKAHGVSFCHKKGHVTYWPDVMKGKWPERDLSGRLGSKATWGL